MKKVGEVWKYRGQFGEGTATITAVNNEYCYNDVHIEGKLRKSNWELIHESNCLKELITTKKEESNMRKCIADVFEKTQDALLVEKYDGMLLPSTGNGGSDDFTTVQVVKANKEAILKEAKRLEKEAEK